MSYEKSAKVVATHPGKHGDHPFGGVIGAATGALAGAAVVGAVQGVAFGTIAGFPGMAAGVAIGGVVGALTGKAAAQEVNPTTEDAFWNDNYQARNDNDEKNASENYDSAHSGITAHSPLYPGRSFDEIEPHLSKNQQFRDTGDLTLPWDETKSRTRNDNTK